MPCEKRDSAETSQIVKPEWRSGSGDCLDCPACLLVIGFSGLILKYYLSFQIDCQGSLCSLNVLLSKLVLYFYFLSLTCFIYLIPFKCCSESSLSSFLGRFSSSLIAMVFLFLFYSPCEKIWWSLLEKGDVMILVLEVSDWKSLISCLYTDFSQKLVFYSTSDQVIFIPVANNNKMLQQIRYHHKNTLKYYLWKPWFKWWPKISFFFFLSNIAQKISVMFFSFSAFPPFQVSYSSN